MSDRVNALIAEAQKLSEAERLAVAEGILETIHAPDSEVEQMWLRELQARHEAYKAGSMPVVDYEDVRKRFSPS